MALVAAVLPEPAIAYSCTEITPGPGMCGDDYASPSGEPRFLLVGAFTGLAVALPIFLAIVIGSMRRNIANLCLVGIPVQFGALVFALADYGRHLGSPFLPSYHPESLEFHEACIAILAATVLAEILLFAARR